MANAEHLRILNRGIDIWNHWREANPKIAPDLTGVSCIGVFLRDQDLTGVDFSGNGFITLSLNHANLSCSDLSRAKFISEDLRDINFSGANLSEADLSGSDLSGVDLSRTDLRYSDLSDANLSGANLAEAKLNNANLSDTNFSGANLSDAELFQANCRNADLSRVDLRGVDLSDVDFSEANLSDVDLREIVDPRELANYCINFSDTNLSGIDFSDPEIELEGIDLSYANLSDADFYKKDLTNLELYGSNLSGAELSYANLNGNNLAKADLRYARLVQTQALDTNFENAIFTGACLKDWNINSETVFEGVICEYFYRKANQQERRPREGTFKPGEFAALCQQAVDTVDLIFKDGIDWQAFFQSFQSLRNQYADQELAIQAIERKQGGAFIVRLEVSEGADKTAIEATAKELYEAKLVMMEERYRAELQAKEREIVTHKEQSANLLEIVKLQASRPITIETTAVADQSSSTNQTFNATVGNAAGNNYGSMSAIQNNYGSNAEDITRLLTALRSQAQTFPTEQKDDTNDVLNDLERDLADEQPDQNRISRRLKKLVALGAAIGTIASGAAAVSGDVSTFTGNVIELTEQLGIPVEQVQLPASGIP